MDQVILFSIPIFLTLLSLEAYFSYKQGRGFFHLKDTFGNLGAGILSQLVGVFSKVFLFGAYVWVSENLNLLKPLGFSPWAQDFSTPRGIASWVVVFILVDFLYYLYHRHSHEVNLLWAAHVVHHSSEEYNLSVALRQSSFAAFFNIFYFGMLAFLGVPVTMFLFCYGLNLIYQFWVHTRYIKRLGWFEKIFNSPSHHRVHHARQEKYLDKNYAGVLIIWDRMLGTFKAEEEEPKYGIYPRFRSYDSIRANLLPMAELFYYVRVAKGTDKFRVLFKGPLWLYENFKKGKVRGIKGSPAVADKTSIGLFSGALAAAVVVLFNPELDWVVKLVLFGFVILLLRLLGKRLDAIAE